MLYQRGSFSVPASAGVDARLLEKCQQGEHGMVDRRGFCVHCGNAVKQDDVKADTTHGSF